MSTSGHITIAQCRKRLIQMPTSSPSAPSIILSKDEQFDNVSGKEEISPPPFEFSEGFWCHYEASCPWILLLFRTMAFHQPHCPGCLWNPVPYLCRQRCSSTIAIQHYRFNTIVATHWVGSIKSWISIGSRCHLPQPTFCQSSAKST